MAVGSGAMKAIRVLLIGACVLPPRFRAKRRASKWPPNQLIHRPVRPVFARHAGPASLGIAGAVSAAVVVMTQSTG